MGNKFKQFTKKLIDILDDILAYMLTIIGILFSNYVPLLKNNQSFELKIEIPRMIVSSIIALMIVSKQEMLELDENGSKERSKIGRKKRFWTRMFNALAQGMAWSQITQLGI